MTPQVIASPQVLWQNVHYKTSLAPILSNSIITSTEMDGLPLQDLSGLLLNLGCCAAPLQDDRQQEQAAAELQ